MYGFDWRRSASDNAAELLTFIDRVLQVTGAPRVNVLAHSQGGLVAESPVTEQPTIVGKVNRVITLGTPYLGAAKAVGVLRYKSPCVIPLEPECFVEAGEVQRIGRNMPGLLDLLPSQQYWSLVGPPIDAQYDSDGDGQVDGPVTFEQYHRRFSDPVLFNQTLIDQSYQWHLRVDPFNPLDPDSGFVRLVGTRLPTIEKMVAKMVEHCVHALGGIPIPLPPICSLSEEGTPDWTGNGDGTVPRGSAEPDDDYLTTEFEGKEHQLLAQDSHVLAFALSQVQGQGPIVRTAGDPAVISADGTLLATGEPPAPTGPSGLLVRVTGPAIGYLTDQDGWRTGTVNPSTSEVVEDIPGSSFFGTSWLNDYVLTGSGTTPGRWVATADGELALTLRNYTLGTNDRTVAYPPFAVDTGAVVTLPSLVAPLATPPALSVDDNGDGVADRTIAPMTAVTGTSAPDEVLPATSATVTHYTATDGSARVHVTLTATDNAGGSGSSGGATPRPVSTRAPSSTYRPAARSTSAPPTSPATSSSCSRPA